MLYQMAHSAGDDREGGEDSDESDEEGEQRSRREEQTAGVELLQQFQELKMDLERQLANIHSPRGADAS